MADRLTPAEQLDLLELKGNAAEEAGLLARARGALGGKEFLELWKYTPSRDFIDGFDGITVARPVIQGLDQPGVALTSRSLLTSLSDSTSPGDPTSLSDLTSGLQHIQDPDSTQRFPLADVALLLAGELLVLEVDGTPEAPIRIEHGSGLMLPLLVRLAPGASARLVEEAPAAGFCNESIYIHLADDASLEHAFAALGSTSCHWSLTQVHQAARSRYHRQQYQTGGSRRRSETQILLNGPEATADITGAYVVEGGSHLDQQLVIEHRAAQTRSQQRFHGIGAGKGTAVFNGRIHIHPGAPGADAALSNRNLALHPDAIINTKPELEIYTDDVRCSHGATVGQISDESLFYLQSRGLNPAQAKRMLCRAFITECIEGSLAEVAEQGLLGDWTQSP